MVKVLFYKGRRCENNSATLFDNFICWLTDSRFSHVELAFDTSEPYVYECWSSSTRDGGVRVKRIDTSSENWVILSVDKDVSAHKLLAERGKKYDYTGLIGAVLTSEQFQNEKRRFCSEFVGAMLDMPDAYLLTPEELYERLVGLSSLPVASRRV